MDHRCVLFVDDGLWRLACAKSTGFEMHKVDMDEGDVQSKAQRVADLMKEYELAGPVVLGLPSHWCLIAEVDTAGLGRSNRRQAMRYLLEEQIPIAAEESVADFIEHSAGALGVAVATQQLEPIVDALQSNEIMVKHLCPTAILAVMPLVASYDEATTLLLDAGAGVDLVALAAGKVVRWWWVPQADGLGEYAEHWRSAAGDRPQHIVSVAVPSARDAFAGTEVVDANEYQQGTVQLATTHAAALISGDVTPLMDFRRDALAGPDRYSQYDKQLALFAATFVIFVLSVIGATLLRSTQYREHMNHVDQQLVALYKQAMPGQRIPSTGMIASRLKSEQRRLAGVGGVTGAAGQAAGEGLQQTSALTHLHTVLMAWPDNLRYRISDLTIEPSLIRVNGQAADAVIPDKLAASLRATGIYAVDPANTRALSDFGFSFGFLARPMVKDSDGESEAAVQ